MNDPFKAQPAYERSESVLTPCDGYCADLGCDKVAVVDDGRCSTWKQYCTRCAARVKSDGEFFKERFG